MPRLAASRRPQTRRLGSRTALLSALALIACPLPGTSALQGQVLTGRVLDHESDTPVAVAEVRLLFETGGEELSRTVSDSLGRFLVPTSALSGRMYRLRVSAFGYEEVLTPPFLISPQDSVAVEVYVSPHAVPLAPLAVLATRPLNQLRLEARGYYTRKLAWGPDGSGLAHFLDPEDVANMPPSSRVSDFLRDLRGVYVGGSGARSQVIQMRSTTDFSRNRCVPAFYLDGSHVRLEGTGQTIDGVISGNSVSAIEVYPSINKPAEFGELQEFPCGAVVIWSGSR